MVDGTNGFVYSLSRTMASGEPTAAGAGAGDDGDSTAVEIFLEEGQC